MTTLRRFSFTVFAWAALSACVPAPGSASRSRTFRCERDGGCTVTSGGKPTHYHDGVDVPYACGAGIVVIAGCGCGPLPSYVSVACGCGPSCGSACGACGSSCGSGCGSCGGDGS